MNSSLQCALAAMALAGGCAGALAGTLEGSRHDFTAQSWVPRGQICVACHTPVESDALSKPALWARPLASTSYRVYASHTLKANIGQPGTASKICLSCHDGTLAVDSFGGLPAAGAARSGPGRDLANDHPIGFTYDAELARRDHSLFDPSSRAVTIGSGDRQRSGGISSVMLIDGRMECPSCHDVHNLYTVRAPSPGQGNKFLKVSAGGSAICMACHDR